MPHDAELQRRIRERAFQIWIEEGQPRGRDKLHWLIAEAELTSGLSPPLQPDPPIGRISRTQEETERQSEQPRGLDVPSTAGGINPDDVTR